MKLQWFRENGISVVDFLRSNELLRRLDRRTMKMLARVLMPVELPAGQALFQQGAPGDRLYFVASGRLRAVRTLSDGTKHILGEVGPSEIVGEAALLTDEPRYATVECIEDSNVLSLSRDHFQKLLADHPEEIQFFAKLITRRHEDTHREKYRPVSRDLLEFLRTVPLFAALPRAVLGEIESHLVWLHLPAGHDLMKQGDPSDGLYVVLGGRLAFQAQDAQGALIRSGTFGRGELIGELAILTGEKRSATVTALRDCELVKLPDISVQRLLKESPKAVFALTRTLADRMTRNAPLGKETTYSAIAVIPVSSSVNIEDFAHELNQAMARTSRTLLCRSKDLEHGIGVPISKIDPDNPRHEMFVWFSQQEEKADFLILQGSHDEPLWNESCMRQADLMLLVADVKDQAMPTAPELRLLGDAGRNVAGESRLVLLQPRGARTGSETEKFLKAHPASRHHHVRKQTPEDMERLARAISGKSVGVVLGGGGARGLAHIGVIQALRDAGTPIDLLCGTSAGAIVSGIYAALQDPDQLKATIREMAVTQNPLNDYTFPFVSLVRGRRYSRTIQEAVGDVRIEDLLLPYAAVACDLTISTEAVFMKGPLWKAMRASSSLPGIAPPLYEDGHLFVDGGLLNNLPVDVMRKLGAHRILAVDVSDAKMPEDEAYGQFLGVRSTSVAPGFLKMLGNRLRPPSKRTKLPSLGNILMRSTMIGSVLKVKQARQDATIYARLPVDPFGLLEWTSMDAIVEVGRSYAAENADLWKDRLGA